MAESRVGRLLSEASFINVAPSSFVVRPLSASCANTEAAVDRIVAILSDASRFATRAAILRLFQGCLGRRLHFVGELRTVYPSLP